MPSAETHLKNSLASETPVTDGERVYAYFGSIGLLAAVDLNGKVVWSKDFGPPQSRNNWGTGASPTLYKDRVYLVNDNETQSFTAAFDKRTGEQIWRVNRDEGSNWSTPFVWEREAAVEIVTSGSDKVRSYDLNGKLLWEFKGMSAITIPTPFAGHGLVFIGSGWPTDTVRPVFAIRPGAAGDISLKPGETSNKIRRVVAPRAPNEAPRF